MLDSDESIQVTSTKMFIGPLLQNCCFLLAKLREEYGRLGVANIYEAHIFGLFKSAGPLLGVPIRYSSAFVEELGSWDPGDSRSVQQSYSLARI